MKRAVVKKKGTTNYIDNKKFLAELTEYRKNYYTEVDAGMRPPRLPDYLATCFLQLAEKFSRHKKYFAYPFRDDMVSDAVLCCVKYAHNFDPEKSSQAFGYFTMVVKMAFHQRIAKEKKYLYTKFKCIQDTELFSETIIQDGSEHATTMAISPESRYNMVRYIEQWESKNLVPKKK